MKHFGKEKIDFIFDEVINTLKFFPKISEILEIANHLPPSWINKELTIEKITDEEKKELEKILNEIGG